MDDILRFVSDFTVYVQGVGDVCRFVNFLVCSISCFNKNNYNKSSCLERLKFGFVILLILQNFSLSLFDFEKHGNKHYGSPCDAIKDMRSSQGKMEKSFLRYENNSCFYILIMFTCCSIFLYCRIKDKK